MSRYHIDINTRVFHFKEPAGTSRGVYRTRTSRFVHLTCDDLPGIVGVGECAPLPKLSCDDLPDYDAVLRRQCDEVCIRGGIDVDALRDFPSPEHILPVPDQSADAVFQHTGSVILRA